MILFSGEADQNEQGEKVEVGVLAWPLYPLEVSRFIGMGGFCAGCMEEFAGPLDYLR
jgi:hypothetical protein